MRRGDLVTIAIQGDFGKPRPALVIQNDVLLSTRNVLVCPLTSSAADIVHLRYRVAPSPQNGLRLESSVMLTNLIAVPREKCGPVIGALGPEQMVEIGQTLAFILGLTD